jgi:hypothetical protein
LRFSAHSARVAQTLLVASRVPIVPIFSQTTSLGSPFFDAGPGKAGVVTPVASSNANPNRKQFMAASSGRDMKWDAE